MSQVFDSFHRATPFIYFLFNGGGGGSALRDCVALDGRNRTVINVAGGCLGSVV